MPLHKILGALAAALVSACALDTPRLEPPRAASVVPLKADRPLIALALGSGGARGFAHVGVIKALEAAGIKPDIVTGASSGSIVAALYAGGYSGAQLERLAVDLDQTALIDFTLFGSGWVKGEALQDYINEALGHIPIERLKKPVGLVATDSSSGRMVIFNEGNPGLAVRASSSVPQLFIPPVIRGVTYLDGGLTSPVPVRVARAMGADVVIAVDLTRYARSIALADEDLRDADVVIRPQTVRTRLLDFTAKLQNIAAGEEAAREASTAVSRAISAALERKERRSGAL